MKIKLSIAIAANHNDPENQRQRVRNFLPLVAEVTALWNQENILITPIVA